MEIVDWHEEVVQVALSLLEGGGVSEGSLVVGDGPLGGAHHSQVVVAVGVQGAQHGVLSSEATAGNCEEVKFKTT